MRSDMKTYMILSVILVGVLLAAVALAAPEDRFKGGTNDGYGKSIVSDTSVLVVVVPTGTVIYVR